MLQGFLGAFPQYIPSNSSNPTVGVNLFVESYGGKYGPAFATLWERQNKARLNGTISKNGTLAINLVSLGIINGCVDDLVQAPYWPYMANDNSYGLTAINPTRASLANASFYAAGGCRDLINQCRASVLQYDQQDVGANSSVNSICSAAYSSCEQNVMDPYNDAGRSVYDIAALSPDPFPSDVFLEYLNLPSVQASIGTPVNFTQTSLQVVSAFTSTGDYERDSLVSALAALVKSGIRVGLIYGDRDYICNWYGGEAISLSVAANISSVYSSKFPAAGYAPIIVNSSYIGGVVRQYGNLSFSRIYEAGHQVPAYQPETAFQVFARIISGTSVSTGAIIDISSYNTTGPLNSTFTTTLPASSSPTCWLRDIPNKCTNDQKNMIVQGEGVIINGVLYDASSDWPLYTSVATGTGTATATTKQVTSTVTTTTVMTGFYTATATPSSKSGGAMLKVGWNTMWIVVVMLGLATW